MSNPVKDCPRTSLLLPKKCYGPLCCKIMRDFIAHHNLPIDLELPEKELSFDLSLSRIFDVMVHSMGEEKRKDVLKYVEEYNNSLPPTLRNHTIISS